MTEPCVPVTDRWARAFPTWEEGEPATYLPLSQALTTRFEFDAHAQACAWPSVPRRLGGDAGFALGAKMVAFVVDVDAPGKNATAEWWSAQLSQLQVLLQAVPGGFIYRTSGGYRVVYRLKEPLQIRSKNDANRWKQSYLEWLNILDQELNIRGDTTCSDVWRLFRLPHVVRDGVAQELETLGDPSNIGEWSFEYAAPVSAIELLDDKDLPSPEIQQEAAKLLSQVWPLSETRHITHLALYGALLREGWNETAVAKFAASVAELAEPGNADYSRRLKNVRDTARRLKEGSLVTGWTRLLELIDGGTVIRVRELLTTKEIVKAPRSDELDAAFQAAETKLLRQKSKADSLVEGNLLRQVRQGKPIFIEDEVPEQTLTRAVLAVVKHAPDGTTDAQISHRLASSAGVLHTSVAALIPKARASLERQEESKRPLDEFVLSTSGPMAGMPSPSNQHNHRVAFRKLGIEFTYNAFSGQELMTRDGETVVVEDQHIDAISFECEDKFSFYPPPDKFYRFVATVARQRSFHPVLDYLDSRPPDISLTGPIHPERWLIDFAGVEDTPLAREISRIVLVAAVRRIRKPGCKFDEMLILEGPQGVQKSTLLKTLMPDPGWFTDTFRFDEDPRRMMEATAGRWIIESSELVGLNTRDSSALKQWMSQAEDASRLAYARKQTRVPRQFIIIGTVNGDQYLSDSTGNRRYWPFKVGRIDVEGLKAARDTLWAQAARLEAENPAPEYIRLSPSLYEAAAIEQRKRETEDAYDVVLGPLLQKCEGKIRAQDVWRLCGFDPGGLPAKIPNKSEMHRIKSAMQKLGWEYFTTSESGESFKAYRRGIGSLMRIVGSGLQGFSLVPETDAPN